MLQLPRETHSKVLCTLIATLTPVLGAAAPTLQGSSLWWVMTRRWTTGMRTSVQRAGATCRGSDCQPSPSVKDAREAASLSECSGGNLTLSRSTRSKGGNRKFQGCLNPTLAA